MQMVIPKSWREVLDGEFHKPYLSELRDYIYSEVSEGKRVYPPLDEVFKAFSYTPYEGVKVVIIGQDPYHGPGQAEGLCFSVKKGVKVPPSLQNIYKELAADIGAPIPTHGSLVDWANQGVLLLNATLTVREGEPKSHYGRGWETFTDAVVAKLIDREDPIVFILWGKSAQEKGGAVESSGKGHVVLKSAHPSPFSAHRFFGCRHFSQANKHLIQWGKLPIDWVVK